MLARWIRRALLAAAWLSAAAAVAAPAVVERAAEPRWVQPLALDGLDDGLQPAPLQVLLADRQTRLGAAGVASQRYHRSVRQVRDAAGLESAAQFEIEFDPGYERLTLHRLDLLRGKSRLDKLDLRRVRVLQRETGLEQRRLDGRSTASIVLDDVRVGDRIEIAYTITGDNPVFGGRFVELDWSQQARGPTGLYRYRLLAPPQRTIHHRAGAAEAQAAGSAGGLQATEFRRRRVPQFVGDPYAPYEAYIDEQLQLSEFADWAEVARWAEGLFRSATRPTPEVVAQAAALRGGERDAQLLALLDFVQTQVRYFGTEIGASSHQPAPAAQVLAQRYGDCKDKVALLAALADAAGVQATPVLVSNGLRRDVQKMLPSPLAFDHAIAVLDLGDRKLWVDATRSMQTGTLDERQVRGLGWGLRARAGAALEALPGHEGVLQAEAEDTISFTRLSEPAVFEAVQTYHGDLAEGVRANFAARGAEEFARDLRSDHLRLYPGLVPDGALEIGDVPQRNALRLVQRYKLAPPWRFPEQRLFVADYGLPLPMSVLRLPDTSDRSRALRLSYPGIYRQSVEFRYAEDVLPRSASSSADESAPAFRLHLRADTAPRSQRVEAELEMLQDRVAAADFPAYREKLTRVFPRLAGVMQLPPIAPAQLDTLRQRFAALDTDLRAGRVRAVTPVQRDALMQHQVLALVLDSDRLTTALRVQTLTARAVLLDHLGRLDDARQDLAAAFELNPAAGPTHVVAAVNASLRGAQDEARRHAEEALRLTPDDGEMRQTLARIDYLSGDAAAARDALQAVLQNRAERDGGYAGIWLYLATRRAGGDGVAALRQAWPTAAKPAWPHPVARWLAGDISFDAALAATREGGSADPGRECELQFFAGQKALLDGDRAAARRHFRRSVDTGVTEFVEYGLARLELQRLND